MAPNGHLLTAAGDAINAGPKQPSEIVEFTKTGQFVSQLSIDPGSGGAFGLAVKAFDDEIRFAAVFIVLPNPRRRPVRRSDYNK